ncbi:MAG: replicative DNA helicase [Lentisphaerae bacterium]|nr:replicative DNA helicase [Lentisphaerota bacterium]MCP4100197.1 replicative DNA helicase [Lentisphaerota bacterium]
MAGDKDKYQKNRRVPGVLSEERPQPHNLEAERAVLAAMLKEPSTCIDIAIQSLGTEEVFYSHVHRELFKTIADIYNQSSTGVDLIAIADQLTKTGKLDEMGGQVFLADLYNTIATTVNIDGWCDIIREYATLRKMINICTESLLKCYDEDIEVKTLVDQIETDVFNVRNMTTKNDVVNIRDSLGETFRNIQDLINGKIEIGIPTGLPDLNKLVGGFKRGEMFVLAARPSIGKTSLALNLLRNVAMKETTPRSVAFFSLEMTAEQITRRLICTEAKIPESRFFDGSFKPSEMTKLTSAVSELQKTKIFIDPTGGLTIAELRAKARRLKMMENIELIAIDYLQLMKADGRIDSRQQEVAEISSGIKKLAKDLNVPVLVLAQLNREVEKTSGASAHPKLSHLRESGTIEQDADIVAFLHRDRDEAKSPTAETLRNGLDAKLIIEKNRNGQTGILDLKFYPDRMEFVNLSKYGDKDRPPNLDE